MNTIVLHSFVVEREISRLQKLPLHSKKREKVAIRLLQSTERYLISSANVEIHELLLRKYLCPFQLLPHEERNVTKIADIIVRAIADPGFVKELCFVSSIGENVKQSLVEKMSIHFWPYVVTEFRFFKGRDILRCTAA